MRCDTLTGEGILLVTTEKLVTDRGGAVEIGRGSGPLRKTVEKGEAVRQVRIKKNQSGLCLLGQGRGTRR